MPARMSRQPLQWNPEVDDPDLLECMFDSSPELAITVHPETVDPQTKRVYTTGMIKKGLDVLSKQGGVKKGDAAPKGSSETSGQATPMTDNDNESASGSNSKRKRSGADVDSGCD
ncbi:hypothetical protein AYL99_12005 [Fonsecaea erecta]|uniref:Ribosome maturation protein SDO1/SBDS central domain-containing protein n=1 Tax=Fonsecaea erecta TaxID=1367422 RepID=A0A178Z2Z9_9EURO|nr:hypothetical protein AYL99_12005 [Fonsecaea erecta]OAP53786.1 hypothetical protein AYL99_12005 [Fonsecaea erecta]